MLFECLSLCWLNSLAPGKFELSFRFVIFKQILMIDGRGILCEIALIWMPLRDFTDNQSTLVQVMAWCHQATSHYLSQCWPRSLSPSGITRPQWVKHDHKLYYVYICIICMNASKHKLISVVGLNPVSADSLYIKREPHVFLIVPAYALAPNSAKPSVGTVLTTEVTHLFY